MQDLIVILVLAVILGAAVRYLYKQKKSGARCVGCSGSSCNGDCSGCSCGCPLGEKK